MVLRNSNSITNRRRTIDLEWTPLDIKEFRKYARRTIRVIWLAKLSTKYFKHIIEGSGAETRQTRIYTHDQLKKYIHGLLLPAYKGKEWFEPMADHEEADSLPQQPMLARTKKIKSPFRMVVANPWQDGFKILLDGNHRYRQLMHNLSRCVPGCENPYIMQLDLRVYEIAGDVVTALFPFDFHPIVKRYMENY